MSAALSFGLYSRRKLKAVSEMISKCPHCNYTYQNKCSNCGREDRGGETWADVAKAADNPFCMACQESGCIVSLDGTCAMIRAYQRGKAAEGK